MQDGIISGNGNSRYLKTVAAALSLYPDYESFMAALIAGTFPIDLNGINAGGWTQQGTPLNKATLFSDSTANALGLTAKNTPDDALAKLKTLVDTTSGVANAKIRMTTGTFTGDNTDKRFINLGFNPKMVIVYIYDKGDNTNILGYMLGAMSISGITTNDPKDKYVEITNNGFYVYTTPDYYGVNRKDNKCVYAAFW